LSYIGDFALESTLDFKFCTTAAATGAPTTLAGTPVISAYVGNSTTQLTAGITLTVDFDAVTGLHNVRVAATAANGYATASNYQLVITAGTVGGTSAVGYVVGEFSIEARSAVRPTVAARTLDVTATGAAGIDLANVENQGATLGLTGTTILAATTATNLTNNNDKAGYALTATTGLGNQTSNITGNLSGSVGSVTGAVGSVTGAVGSVTGAVGSVTANVNAVLINGAHGGAAATAAFGGAGGITSTVTGNVTGSVGSLATQAKADVNAEVVDALATDTYAEPGQGAPAATTTLSAKINYIYKFLRNKVTTTATTVSVYDDAGTTVDQKSTVSDDATTFTRGEFGTGP